MTRLSLATLQATGMAFFGFHGSTSVLAMTVALSAVVSCIGIGFQRGTHTRWQLVANEASGSPTLLDRGASSAIATGGVLTLRVLTIHDMRSLLECIQFVRHTAVQTAVHVITTGVLNALPCSRGARSELPPSPPPTGIA